MEISENSSPGFLSKMKKYVQNLNLFPSTPPTTDAHELGTQLISTRLFIVMMAFGLYILLIYMAAFRITTVVIEPKITLDRYQFLYAQYSETLSCPCTNTSINNDQMLLIEYELHQVCSSALVSESWLQFLLQVRNRYDSGSSITYSQRHKDLRASGPLLFQGLLSLCKIASEAIDYNLEQTYITQYTSLALLSPLELQIQGEMNLESLISSTTTELLLSMQMIRGVIQVNAIASSVESNAIYMTDFFHRYFELNSYDNCSCIRNAQCVQNLSTYEYSDMLYSVPHMFTGCFVLEALLKSSLACFYSKECVDEMIRNIRFDLDFDFNVVVMDSSQPSQFSIDSTVDELFNELMVEHWSWTPLYENYFNACQPAECKYTYSSKASVAYIVTTVFGIIGGLSTSLQIIVPRLVAIVRRRKRNIPSINGNGGKLLYLLEVHKIITGRQYKIIFGSCKRIYLFLHESFCEG